MSNKLTKPASVFGLVTVLLIFWATYLGLNNDSGVTTTPFATEEPTATLISIPTLPPIFQAVTKEDTICYFGTNEGYDAYVTIPQFSIVSVLGQDTSGQWMLVRLEGFADCWIRSTVIQLKGNESLPVITSSLPPVITPVPSSTTVITTQLANQTPIPSIGLAWKILSFDCLDGRATRALVGLDVSGGVPPYSYSQQLPMYARPEQIVSITVKSSTSDGEPSNRISFPIPRASDFKCDKEGSNPVPQPTIAPPTIVPPTVPPIPTINGSTSTPSPACSDGEDNDGDKAIDFGSDPECDSPSDSHENL